MSKRAGVRDQILDGVAEILEVKGLRHLNTNALAVTAGVTPPTVYRHFANKEAAVTALAERFIEAENQWLNSAIQAIGNDASIEDSINALIDAYWHAAQKQQGIVALRGAMRVWPELKTAEENSLANSTDLVAGLFRDRWEASQPKELNRVSRYVVETVCSTVDRCYSLGPVEQRWRLTELKKSVVAYISDRMS